MLEHIKQVACTYHIRHSLYHKEKHIWQCLYHCDYNILLITVASSALLQNCQLSQLGNFKAAPPLQQAMELCSI